MSIQFFCDRGKSVNFLKTWAVWKKPLYTREFLVFKTAIIILRSAAGCDYLLSCYKELASLCASLSFNVYDDWWQFWKPHTTQQRGGWKNTEADS